MPRNEFAEVPAAYQQFGRMSSAGWARSAPMKALFYSHVHPEIWVTGFMFRSRYKANFPSRIAFAVASQVDSRTILDSVGADRLLGRGDMLFLSSSSPKPRRVQGAFIGEEEVELLAAHWRTHAPQKLAEIPLEELAREAEVAAVMQEPNGRGGLSEADSLYDRALQLATSNRQLSTSLLQRRLRIGYPRAARLMDQLEEEGIVASSAEPGKPREVLYRPEG